MKEISHIPTRPAMAELLGRLLPGRSKAIQQLREQILDFSSSLTAHGLLLRGPIGAGKSTIARAVALLKRVAPLNVEEAQQLLGNARFEGHNRIDLRYIPWYVELALTGLVETLADVQLFGATKGAYTGAAIQRAGVFEQASTARSEKGKEHEAARLTGGVVFLDEIGDLSAGLQGKLLPVLSGGAYYRVGGEGDQEHELQFRGTVVTASWRNLDSGLLRPDLLSRVSAYVADVPGLADRMEDFDELLEGVQESVRDSIANAIDHADTVEPKLDRDFWRERRKSIPRIDDTARRRLSKVDWSRHGNLRGLSAAVEQIIATGRPIDELLEELPLVIANQLSRSEDGLVERLLEVAEPGSGLAGHMRTVEVQLRDQLRARLAKDLTLLRRLARKLNLTEQQLSVQLRDLGRRRLKDYGDKE